MLHAGLLVITGRAPDQLTFTYPGRTASKDVHASAEAQMPDAMAEVPHGETGATVVAANQPVSGDTAGRGAVEVNGSARRDERTDVVRRTGAGTPPPEGPHAPLAIPSDAVAAMVGLGFKPAEARSALVAARTHVGGEPTLEAWIREGLRACGRAQRSGSGLATTSAKRA